MEARARPVGPLSPVKRLDLVIALPLRDQEGLAELIREIYDPKSPRYRQYLTPEQFAEQFGPTEKDYEAVIAFAKSHQLTVAGTHPNRTLLDVNGSVSDIEKALHVKMRLYRHRTEARTFFAPDLEPSVDLDVPLLVINGLDDFNLPRPMNFKRRFKKSADAIAYATGSGPRGNFIGRDFRAAYAPGVKLDGRGQSVGLFQLDGYYPNDIAAYASLAGLPNVPLTNVFLNGFPGTPGFNNTEVALDIDMAISMAPGLSKVIVYQGRVPNDILNRMATDNEAKQLSSSWSFGSQIDPARQQIFQQFAAQGQSFFQASGDLGAWVGAIPPPSDDPFVTVVGGTALTTNPDGSWLSETTWSPSGGGISTSYPIPIWQQAISMVANKGSSTMRNIPDVACLADDVIWLVANNGEYGSIGGTSASAPLWAGLTALVNEQAEARGQPAVGFINPAVYAIGQGPGYASVFHDITTGNNTNSASANKFFAVAEYDLCTGWGTPTGSNLINALLAPADALQIRPNAPSIFSGPPGGPFSPASHAYLVTNEGVGPLSWTSFATAPWLAVSPGNGTVQPGGPAQTITVTLTSAANTLPVGSYGATLWFTNLSNGFGQSRSIFLDVVALPMITSQPANQTVFEGATASLTVGTSSNAGLSYKWRFDSGAGPINLTDASNVFGSATRTLTVSNVSPANAGAYSVIVSNAAGSVTSSNALLIIAPSLPVIVEQPASQTALPGESVLLSLAAVGNRPLFYRWKKDEADLTDSGNISGVATRALRIANVSAADAGMYSVVVSNSLGSALSSNAVLSIASVTAPDVFMETLYSFTGYDDGANPNGLILAKSGRFFGTTQNGGKNLAGTVFSMTTNGSVTPLCSFSGQSDGANPYAALTEGPDGFFYGTTFQGGAVDNGTIFKISASGTFFSLFSFNGTNGDFPFGALIPGADSNFYGTCYQGGAFGRGTVFKISTNGVHTILYSFSNGGDGGHPAASLTQTRDGTLRSTTYKGGAFGRGTVFRVTTNGALTTLASFNSTNGSFPYAGLARGDDDSFYGVTSQGGLTSNGTVFKITSEGLLTNIHTFGGGIDGSEPAATLFQSSDGNFYGTTASGGNYGDGTVFRIAPNGTLATLAHFEGFNGANPRAALAEGLDGQLYGTTENGGAYGHGAVFRISTSAAPQVTSDPENQAVFEGATVIFSVAAVGTRPLLYQWQKNGVDLTNSTKIFGSNARVLILSNVTVADIGAYRAIVRNSQGSATSAAAFLQVTSSPPFIVEQPVSQTLLPGTNAILSVKALGNLPLFYQWQRNGTNLNEGGNVVGTGTSTLTFTRVTEANNGSYRVVVSNSLDSVVSSPAILTIVPPSAPGTRFSTLYSFAGESDGRIPNGLIQATNGDLYGTTQFGGTNHFGTIFSMTTNGLLTTLISFRTTNGSIPRAGLIQATDGNFYGTTRFGGTADYGTVFKMTADGAVSVLHSFTPGNGDGMSPLAALVQGTDGNLYGTTQSGGSAYRGTVFKITTAGALTILHSFTNATDGDSPEGALVQASDGHFYGMTPFGGAFGSGNVFKITSEGLLTSIFSFTNGTDGSAPAGALAQGTDGNLYGVTMRNRIQGFVFNGTVFKMTTNGLLTTLYALNFTDGAIPAAGLIQSSDGNFYGTTDQGGANSLGSVFRISPNGAFSTLASFDGFNSGAHPQAALVEATDGNIYGTTTTGGPGGQGTIFRVSITSPPQITAQPANQAVLAGTKAIFSVAVFGARPLFYQWRKNGVDLTDGENISGSTTRTLTVTNVSMANTGRYSVVVSNALGPVTSNEAVLSVVVAPVFQSITNANGTIRLTWSAMVGQRYRLQQRSTLTSGNWGNLGGIITATTNLVTATDSIGANTQRFYRVILVP